MPGFCLPDQCCKMAAATPGITSLYSKPRDRKKELLSQTPLFFKKKKKKRDMIHINKM